MIVVLSIIYIKFSESNAPPLFVKLLFVSPMLDSSLSVEKPLGLQLTDGWHRPDRLVLFSATLLDREHSDSFSQQNSW